MDDYYTAYKNDTDKHIDTDGIFFSKIISRCEFYLREDNILLVTFEPRGRIQTGDILVDEDDREFKVKGFEMLRISGKIPEWYSKIVTVIIQGKDYTIGKYIAKKN